MSLKNYGHEELANMSMVDLADLILTDEKKALDFRDIFKKVAELKGFSEDEQREFIAQFYTDLNINGHFMTLGSNMWGLKRWYPVEQIDEEITAEPKKKKKAKKPKKKKVEEEEETFESVEKELNIVDEDIEKLTGKVTDDDDDESFDNDFDDEDDYDEFDEDDEELDVEEDEEEEEDDKK
ncbi:DNA-directed RNA polymerase subunit delta [Virgibacillus sp. FSP13]